MIPPKCFGICFLFFSLPLVAAFQGKGIVLSLVWAFFVFDGVPATLDFFNKKEWKTLFQKRSSFFSSLVLLGYMLAFESYLLSLKFLSFLFLSFFTLRGLHRHSQEDRKTILRIFLLSYVTYLIFFVLEIYGKHWISRLFYQSSQYNETHFIRGIVILTFFFLPFYAGIQTIYQGTKKKFLLGCAMGILILILARSQPSAARLAIGMAALCYGISYISSLWRKALFGVVALYLLLLPFVFLFIANETTLFRYMHHLPPSYQHRLQIWHNISKRIQEHPFLGHRISAADMVSSTSLVLHYAPKIFEKMTKSNHYSSRIKEQKKHSWGGVIVYKETLHVTHPHNGVLQIWLEFGLCGIIAALWILSRFWNNVACHKQPYMGYVFALFGLCLTYWSVSFGLWQSWLLAVVTLTSLLFQLITPPNFDTKGTLSCTN